MPLVHPNAAGIDVGDTMHAVAVPEGRDDVRVKTFGAMTVDVEAIIAWLQYRRIVHHYKEGVKGFVKWKGELESGLT